MCYTYTCCCLPPIPAPKRRFHPPQIPTLPLPTHSSSGWLRAPPLAAPTSHFDHPDISMLRVPEGCLMTRVHLNKRPQASHNPAFGWETFSL
ncbi:hypothetical protein NQZ68_013529 [Dissostichus eleginoides]|nr:hypothetical protein NQZ68_013529 [Dissostichus eleginoides]